MAESTFRAGGLASGLDSNLIIDKLIELESRPIDIIRKRQSGVKTQITKLGEIKSKLSELITAAKNLGTGGTVATSIAGTTLTGFDAVTGSGAVNGRHLVQVTALASSARGLSQAFASSSTALTTGHIDFTVHGTTYGVDVASGETLADLAFKIRQSGAPVSATVISDGTQSYLSLINNQTGTHASGALAVSDPSGILNMSLTAATDATLDVNGLPITRKTNAVSDVIPGVTLNLKALTASSETLVINNDTAGTQKNLQKFVDSYNNVLKLVQAQLESTQGSDRSASLAGDSSLRSVQSALQGLLTKKVTESLTAKVRTLADVGLKTARDGSLSVDTTSLTRALTNDPQAVNELFSKATTGLAAVTETTLNKYSNFVDGLLSLRTKGLQDSVKKMDTQIASMEMRIDLKRTALIAQFTAMEKVVSGMRSTGNFLNQMASSSGG